MTKTRILVLRGGPSDEYDVSMKTGASVLTALRDSEYDAIDVIITRTGEWLVDGYAKQPHNILAIADVAFIALHGAYGEDGTVQRLLDAHGVPYTGSRAYPSSLAMNKILTKEHLYASPLKMAPHMRVTGDRNTDIARLVHTLIDLLGNECVVKPVSGGSSIGTVTTVGPLELLHALEESLKTRSEILVEKRIRGREATCGVVERFRNQELYILPAVEIVPPSSESFFTHTAKYSGVTDEICPGRFSQAEKESIAQHAALVHRTLGLSQYSRSDFIVADDGVYFLEVNTLPGLTSESLMPKALDAVGCSHRDFVRHLITDTLVRRR